MHGSRAMSRATREEMKWDQALGPMHSSTSVLLL